MPVVDKIEREKMAAKACRICGDIKSGDSFHKGSRRCKECHRAYCRDYYHANKVQRKPLKKRPTEDQKERKRKAAYLRRFGITEEQRDAMLAMQGGVCAICLGDSPNGPSWCTDHDHSCCPEKARSCGKCIRGILCFRCNTLLGHAKDSTATLLNAVDYLERWCVNVGR